MSDSQTDSRNVLIYIDGLPVIDLVGDLWTYPINTPDDQFKLYVTMRTYEPYAVKKFYDLVLPKSKRRTSTETMVATSGGFTEICDFVMNHFCSFEGAALEDGSEPSTAQQRQWLEQNPNFQTRIFRQGTDIVGPQMIQSADPTGKPILLFGCREHVVPTEYRLYSAQQRCIETIKIDIVLDRLTQSEKQRYDKAVAIIQNSRRGETYLETNWDVIEQLCDQKLNRLEGAVRFDGQLCNQSNREEWIERLPLIPKIYAFSQASQDIDLKNG